LVRKGQLSVGFYASLVLFMGVLAYLTFQLFQIVPTTTDAIRLESTRIEAYQLSEVLINDGGHPLDWNTKQVSDIRRIGLSDSAQNKTNLISSLKVTKLKSICDSNYKDVKNLLDIKNEFSIIFYNRVTNENWVCKSPDVTRSSFNVTRIVSIDGNALGEITVQVWQK